MNKFFNKIKLLLQLNKKEKKDNIVALEQRIISLEKANLAVLAKLLQINNIKGNMKTTNKSKLLFTTTKDLDAGKTPTYH